MSGSAREVDDVASATTAAARPIPSVDGASSPSAVSGKLPILVDGGVRSGLDVVRMLALGSADFVLAGLRLGLSDWRS